MAYFVKINNSVFEISKTFADLLKKTYNNIPSEVQDKKHFLILNDFILSSFQVVNTVNQTHFYILISNKKYRIKRNFHKFLSSVLHRNEL